MKLPFLFIRRVPDPAITAALPTLHDTLTAMRNTAYGKSGPAADRLRDWADRLALVHETLRTSKSNRPR